MIIPVLRQGASSGALGLEGDLPRRALSLILDWAELHQQELLLDWELCTKKQMPNKIEPLK